MPIFAGSVVRVTKLATRKHIAGSDMKAVMPARRAGRRTRRSVVSPAWTRSRRARKGLLPSSTNADDDIDD